MKNFAWQSLEEPLVLWVKLYQDELPIRQYVQIESGGCLFNGD